MPGDRIETIFAKTSSISVPGFDTKTSRTSGTGSVLIRRVGPDAVIWDESYSYDGGPAGADTVETRNGGTVNCIDGKCHVNDQTGAPLFNPLLWGEIPERWTSGTRWAAPIARAWEIGPPGSESVRVLRIDPTVGLVTLARSGSGFGASSDDARLSVLTLTGGGRSIKVKVTPGPSHWTGSATIVRGITLSDQIIVEHALDLVAENGEHFTAKQRTYTMFARIEPGA